MNALTLSELEQSAFSTVMDRHREAFHNKLQENNPDLLNFEKHGILSLKAIGVVGIDLIRSAEEFTLEPISDTPLNILTSLPKPETAWEQGSQSVVVKNLIDYIESNESLHTAVKQYMEWHEEEYTHILYDNDIGGHDALFDHIMSLNLMFDEDGEEIEVVAS